MSMVAAEDELLAAGAEIVWVMERTASNAPGTASNCFDFMNQLGATQGWCVGDSQTQLNGVSAAGTFDDSQFSVARGFDMIVPRSSMVVEYTTAHGTPGGNDNVDGDGVLAEVRRIVALQP